MIEKFHIKSYRLDELSALDFSKFEYLPISELRIQSYLKNPRAEPTDRVLFIAFDDKKPIGFRAIFPDKIFTQKGTFRVAVLSGSHTHPDYRRQGISSKILDKVFEDWNGQIIYSNYAPNSQKLYEKSARFQVLKQLSGTKFFLRSPFENILGKRFPELAFTMPILRTFDIAANIFFQKKSQAPDQFTFQKIEKIEPPDNEFITDFLKNKNGTLRGTEALNWIIKNPWISEDLSLIEASKNYPFTLFVKKTERLNFSIKKGEKVVGFLMLFLKNEQLTVPYFYASTQSPEFLKPVAHFIHFHALNFKASTLMIAHPELSDFYKKTGGFIFSKKRNQTFFMSSKLAEVIGDVSGFSIFDGDGDHAFSN